MLFYPVSITPEAANIVLQTYVDFFNHSQVDCDHQPFCSNLAIKGAIFRRLLYSRLALNA